MQATIHHEAARDIPVWRETEVLVCGGGPAGTAAALAARRHLPARQTDPAELRRLLAAQGVLV